MKKLVLLISLFYMSEATVLAGEPVLFRRGVSLEKTSDAIFSRGFLRVPEEYSQNPSGQIIMEAERPSAFESENMDTPWTSFEKENAASEGECIVSLARGTYRFTVSRPGKYNIWYRAWFPAQGNWNHSEHLDNPQTVIQNSDYGAGESSHIDLKHWIWRKGPLRLLTKGKHEFTLDWRGGAKLDQIVFLPEGTSPQGTAVFPPTFQRKSAPVDILLEPFSIPEGEKAVGLHFETVQNRNGGNVTAMISTDAGKSFRELSSNSGIKAHSGERLFFKLRFHPSAGGKTPSLYNLSIITEKSFDVKYLSADVQKRLQPVEKIELIPCQWSGLRKKTSTWNLSKAVIPDADNVLWFDAIHADNLILSPSDTSWIMENAEAFHGKAVYQGVLNRNLASFDFFLPENGIYRPWFRVKLLENTQQYRNGVAALGKLFGAGMPYIPLMYQADGEEPVEYSGEKPFPTEPFLNSEWVWIPCPKIKLEKGSHVFRLRAGLDYMLFDRIALVPENSGFIPRGMGGKSLRRTLDRGEVVFQKLGWISTADIGEIHASGPENARVTYWGSANGNHWMSLESLQKNSASIKQGGFYIKAVIEAIIPGKPASVTSWKINLPVSGKAFRFACGFQNFWFDPFQGTFLGWENRKGNWIIPFGGNPRNIFTIAAETLTPEKKRRKTPLEFEFVRMELSGDTLLLHYRATKEDVRVTVSLKQGTDNLPEWGLTLDNRSTLALRNIEFPQVENLRVSMNPEAVFSTATMPNFGSVDFTAAPLILASPGREITGFKSAFSGSYPGWHSMGWDSFYTKENGAVTIQSRNRDGIGIYFGTLADKGAFRTNLIRKVYVGPGENASVTYAFGWHEGDWHRSADCYSDWAHSWMDFSRVNVNWAKDSDGWVPCAFYYDSACIPTRYATHLVPELRWLGANHFQAFYNGIDNTPGPSVIPCVNTKLGTLEEYREGFASARKYNIHMSTYWDARGWNDDYCDSLLIGRTPRSFLPPEIKIPARGFGAENVTMREDGSYIPFGYMPGDYSLCAGAKPWQDFLIQGIANNYAKLLGASIYHDEACFYTDCFAEHHAHGKQHGMHMEELRKTHRTAIDLARKVYPEAVIAIEGSPDQLAWNADILLFGLSAYANGTAYQYVFPEAKLYRGVCNPGASWFMSLPEYTRYIHLFNRFDTHPDSPLKRQFFAHRKRIRDWMHLRKFMDNLNLTVSKPGIIAKWFKTEEKGKTGALINIQNEFAFDSATVTLRWDKLRNAKAAAAYLLEEEKVLDVKCSREKDGVTVSIPSAKASSILIVAEAPQEESLCVSAVWPQEKGGDKLRLAFANFSGNDRKVSLRYELPSGITVQNAPRELKIQTGVTEIELPMKGIPGLNSLESARITVSDGKHEYRAETLLAPPFFNGGFEVDSAGKGTPDHWRAYGMYWKTLLLRSPALPFPINMADGILDPVNPASGKYSLRLPGKIELPSLSGQVLSSTKPIPPGTVKMTPWYFHTGQRFTLKPESRYRFTFKYRFADDSGILEVRPCAPGPVYGPGVFIRIEAKKGDRQWREGKFTYVSGKTYSEQLVVFANMSGAPVWIDDVKVEEL